MVTDLFNENIFILFLIFAISVYVVDKLSERQKIALIYICTYGLAYSQKIAETVLLPMMFFSLFMLQEFFTMDKKRIKILKNPFYKIVDFGYMSIFQFKIWLVTFSICIRTSTIEQILNCSSWVFDIVSILLFCIAIVWMFNLDEEFFRFRKCVI